MNALIRKMAGLAHVEWSNCIGAIRVAHALLGSLGYVTGAFFLAPLSIANEVDFNRDIRPIFVANCIGCHGGVKQAGGLSLIYHEEMLEGGDSGDTIVPGDPESSYLIERISDDDAFFRMPPADHGPALTADEIELIRKWIEEGANWQEHWAYVSPEAVPVPPVKDKEWVQQTLDYFVLARLESEGLSPSPAAPRVEWLRRVTFDLTGLPPTPDEVHDFIADQESGAYQRVVDRLLDSPGYGERWTSMWLDLARYADTMGYERDPHRDAWPYRDWLIRAFNRDMPFDEFTVKQLAGDLLEDASIEDRIATVFHRNTQTNTEGGTDDEEFRIAAVIDRVNTTWQVWQGIPFGCTQCHSSPYEPIRHDEYYKFLAFFNTTTDCDVDEEFPKLAVPENREEVRRAEYLDERIAALSNALHKRVAPLLNNLDLWQPLKLDSATSSGQTRLVIKHETESEVSELVAKGTISAYSEYELEAPLLDDLKEITALRIEVLPEDLEAAKRTPEMGFVVSQARAWLIVPSNPTPIELTFHSVYCDEPMPFLNPDESLEASGTGWGAYTRQSYPRQAVFLLKEPQAIPPGSRIRLSLKQDRVATGEIALVIRRGRFSVSSSRDWVGFQQAAAPFREERDKLLAERNAIESVEIPVMQEQPHGFRRKSYVFDQGNWLNKGKEVTADVPELLPSISSGVPKDRLALAQWIVSDQNPLTSRVMVNRFWEQLFGVGLVETLENFGASGLTPSHPELLDHLALRFQHEHQWSMKQLLRELVLSSTYRQSSHVTSTLLEVDPNNRLLARGPRTRLQAEMIRDQALLVAGKLSDKRYGPPVKPYQPDGIWRTVYSDQTWTVSEGEDRFRRSLYTYWKRTSPYPSMITFDAPSREVCSVQRITTNTPLQALVTLNDPVYIELARCLADRMLAEGGDTPLEQISWCFQVATGRVSTESVQEELLELYEAAVQYFKEDTTLEAEKLASTPELYALTLVANTVLNLNETLTK